MPNYMDMMGDMIRGLVRAPGPRTADDYDTMARELAGALLAGDDAEVSRLSGLMSRARVQGEFTAPNESDLMAMAEKFPEDANIIGGPIKTAGQSRALSRRADVGGLTGLDPDTATLQDMIDLQEAMNQGVLVRGTANTDMPAGYGDPREDLLSFFGSKGEKTRAGIDPELGPPTRGDVDADIIDAIRQDQLLGIASARAADESAELDALPEVLEMFPKRTDSRVGLPELTRKDVITGVGGGALAAATAYALSRLNAGKGEEGDEEMVASQLVTDGATGAGDGPSQLAAAAEQDALYDDYEDMIADMGDGEPVGNAVPAGRVMGPEDLPAEVIAALNRSAAKLDDDPSGTADLVNEYRPIPNSTPVSITQRTVSYRPTQSRGSRRRRPNYGYSRAMNPSQTRNRRSR